MKKLTQIEYNPYKSRVHFLTSQGENDVLTELEDNSSLLPFQNNDDIFFANSAEDIVKEIDDKQNVTAEGLEIRFIGPDSDYKILQKCIEKTNANSNKHGTLSSSHIARYRSADEALSMIKDDYKKISNEFKDYLPHHDKYEKQKNIGDSIERFNKTIDNEVPVCVIGTYSVGKSAFINSLMGNEILPSRVNASTAKNVRVEDSKNGIYTIEFSLKSDGLSESTKIVLQVSDGRIEGIAAVGQQDGILPEIKGIIDGKVNPADKTADVIMHVILDYFNQPDKDDEFLKKIDWNVSIKVPFVNSLLTDSEARIVFYDTPGSNNKELDQTAHKDALDEFLDKQTNAFPILLTKKDEMTANDVVNIQKQLDDHRSNFSNSNCLVVVSQCDRYTKDELEQSIPTLVKDWHGRSTILFTSPIAAIGEQKKDKNSWQDSSYKQAFDRWVAGQESEKTRSCLPDLNVIPCEGREIPDIKGRVPEMLYDTGIPSVENEILYHVKNYANYMKCVSGRVDLIKSMDNVQEILNEQKEKAGKKKQEAQQKKSDKKKELLEELHSIEVEDITKQEDSLFKEYAGELDNYLLAIDPTLDMIFESVKSDNLMEMDKRFNEMLKADCQENLIDKCYMGDNGIQQKILSLMQKFAHDYAEKLQQFVEHNENSLSLTGQDTLKEFLDMDVHPEFENVKSVLESLSMTLEKALLIPYQIAKRTNGDELSAKRMWIDGKKKSFIRRLRDPKNFSDLANGMFRKTVIRKPLKTYYSELQEWARQYQNSIEQHLDKDNIILSGMEDEIKELDNQVQDLESRVSKLSDVKMNLLTVLNKVEENNGNDQ